MEKEKLLEKLNSQKKGKTELKNINI